MYFFLQYQLYAKTSLIKLTSKFRQRDSLLSVSLLSLVWNTAKLCLKLIVKFGSSLLVSSITFCVKTFTAETQTRPTLVAMLNSKRHVIDAPWCVYRKTHHNCFIGIRLDQAMLQLLLLQCCKVGGVVYVF